MVFINTAKGQVAFILLFIYSTYVAGESVNSYCSFFSYVGGFTQCYSWCAGWLFWPVMFSGITVRKGKKQEGLNIRQSSEFMSIPDPAALASHAGSTIPFTPVNHKDDRLTQYCLSLATYFQKEFESWTSHLMTIATAGQKNAGDNTQKACLLGNIWLSWFIKKGEIAQKRSIGNDC